MAGSASYDWQVMTGRTVYRLIEEEFMEMLLRDWTKPTEGPDGTRGRLVDVMKNSLKVVELDMRRFNFTPDHILYFFYRV